MVWGTPSNESRETPDKGPLPPATIAEGLTTAATARKGDRVLTAAAREPRKLDIARRRGVGPEATLQTEAMERGVTRR
jgi:hypothetical protein